MLCRGGLILVTTDLVPPEEDVSATVTVTVKTIFWAPVVLSKVNSGVTLLTAPNFVVPTPHAPALTPLQV